jgi:hypothetical protein
LTPTRGRKRAAHVIGDAVGVVVHGHARVIQGAVGESAGASHDRSELDDGGTAEDRVRAPSDARDAPIRATVMSADVCDRDRSEALLADARHCGAAS